jgi:hypothetical protein
LENILSHPSLDSLILAAIMPKNNRAGKITAFPGARLVHITALFAACYPAGVYLDRLTKSTTKAF